MNVKIYVTYTDGRKIMYPTKMTKTDVNSMSDFDYYVKLRRLSTIKKAFAVVIDDDDNVVIKAPIMVCWRASTDWYSSHLYFGITICGDRVVYETRSSLTHASPKIIGYEVEYIRDKHGNIIYDREGNPKEEFCRPIRQGDDHLGVKKIRPERLSPRIRERLKCHF